MVQGRKPKDITGQYSGCLKALRSAGLGPRGYYFWECLCDPEKGGCGSKKIYPIHYLKGISTHCGCQRKGKGMRINTQERNQELYDLFKQGATIQDLLERFKLHRYHIYRQLRVEAARRGEDPPYFHKRTKNGGSNVERNETLFAKYQQGLSLGIIAEEFNITRERARQIVNAEARRKGEEKRQSWICTERLPNPSKGSKPIDPHWVERFLNGEITLKSASVGAQVSPSTLSKKIQEVAGKTPAEISKDRTRARNKEIYQKFMEGKSVQELADEYNETTGGIGQRLVRHRKLTGAPCHPDYVGRYTQELAS